MDKVKKKKRENINCESRGGKPLTQSMGAEKT